MTTETSAPEISNEDLYDSYTEFATQESRLARQIAALRVKMEQEIAALTEEMLSAKESKEEAFAELMKRGE